MNVLLTPTFVWLFNREVRRDDDSHARVGVEFIYAILYTIYNSKMYERAPMVLPFSGYRAGGGGIFYTLTFHYYNDFRGMVDLKN